MVKQNQGLNQTSETLSSSKEAYKKLSMYYRFHNKTLLYKDNQPSFSYSKYWEHEAPLSQKKKSE